MQPETKADLERRLANIAERPHPTCPTIAVKVEGVTGMVLPDWLARLVPVQSRMIRHLGIESLMCARPTKSGLKCGNAAMIGFDTCHVHANEHELLARSIGRDIGQTRNAPVPSHIYDAIERHGLDEKFVLVIYIVAVQTLITLHLEEAHRATQ